MSFEYLDPFIVELNDLLINSITIQHTTILIWVKGIIANTLENLLKKLRSTQVIMHMKNVKTNAFT